MKRVIRVICFKILYLPLIYWDNIELFPICQTFAVNEILVFSMICRCIGYSCPRSKIPECFYKAWDMDNTLICTNLNLQPIWGGILDFQFFIVWVRGQLMEKKFGGAIKLVRVTFLFFFFGLSGNDMFVHSRTEEEYWINCDLQICWNDTSVDYASRQ